MSALLPELCHDPGSLQAKLTCSYSPGNHTDLFLLAVLCRAEAKSLWALKPDLDKLGVRTVCVVHEGLPAEIKAFWPEYWYVTPLKSCQSHANVIVVAIRKLDLLLQAWRAVPGYRKNALQGPWQWEAEERKLAMVPQPIQRHLEAR